MARFQPDRLRSLDLDARAVESVERARRQLMRFTQPAGRCAPAGEIEEALMIAVLAAFPDRVARRRTAGAPEFLLSAGGSGRLAEGSVVHQAPLIVAVDAEERTGRKGTRDSAGVLIRLASAVEPEWLAGLYPEKIHRRVELAWNGDAGRVEEATRTLYGDLVLEETVRPASPSDDVSTILLSNALARGPASFGDHEQIPVFARASRFLRNTSLPPVSQFSGRIRPRPHTPHAVPENAVSPNSPGCRWSTRWWPG